MTIIVPGLAVLESNISIVCDGAETRVLKDVNSLIDRKENALLPQIEIENNIIEFDRVLCRVIYLTKTVDDSNSLQKEKECHVTIRGTGSIPALWKLQSIQSNNPLFSRDWISVEPDCGIVLPGSTVDLTVCAYEDRGKEYEVRLYWIFDNSSDCSVHLIS